MSLPILVIKVTKALRGNDVAKIEREVRLKLKDWHVLFVSCLDQDEPKFESYIADKAEPIDLDDLRELLINQIKKP